MKVFQREDYIAYRIRRANETIGEIDILIENKLWNTAVNRMYYACYYAVTALLMKHEIETSSHSGCRQKFGQLFVHTGIIKKELGKHYTDLFEKRHKGDYGDFFDFDENTVIRLLEPSKELIKRIEELLTEAKNLSTA
jgi:uncharacterized protein (UPF0332 family)